MLLAKRLGDVARRFADNFQTTQRGQTQGAVGVQVGPFLIAHQADRLARVFQPRPVKVGVKDSDPKL